MGSALAKFYSVFKGTTEARICMIGLDGAGKTTVLYKLRLNEVCTTIPTIGFNVERVEYKNLTMTIWDIGGQAKLRRLWHHYFEASNGVIFVVDSMDAERVKDVKEELHAAMADERLRDARLLVYANKQDMRGALSASELTDRLELRTIRQKWFVQPTSAVTGQGLYEGLDWLGSELK